MKKRLFLYTILIIFIGLSGFFAVSLYITYTNNLNIAKDSVIETAHIHARLFAGTNIDLDFLVQSGQDTRITIISRDGTVLADSRPLDLDALENHLDRPEIQAALNNSPEAFVRYSNTLGVDMIYYALKVSEGDTYAFVRAAVPVAEINAYLYRSLPLLILILFIVGLLCFIFSRGMIIRITKPFESIDQKLRLISSGKYNSEPIAESYGEINQITQSIDEVAQLLQKSINDLRDEKYKLDYILDNINDGLIVLDGEKNVVLINTSALGIFNAKPDVMGKNLNYLSFNNELTETVNECANHAGAAIFEFVLNGRIYLAAVKRLPDTGLTMAALSDVTENRENAKRREEFFANASHELKTPLTAIKGFNELTAINNKDEKIQKYIDGITRETERMLTLIGDMLKLSELENTRGVNPVPVSLAKVVSEVQEALSSVINEKSIVFEVVGEAEVNAEQEHIYELVKNLIENAVRYNDQGGRVSVTIESDKKGALLFIFDDGIGIPPEEQTRIFERFYRVEKSRSVRSGGTGLGLSIVKHICALYDWKLSLKSKLGVGTEVSVTFR